MQKVKVVPSRVIRLILLRIQKRNVLLLFQMQEQQENVSSNSKGIINKIKQENKCIPDLIFQIEDCERYLIQLSKVTKMNLLRYAKRSTARDFKIIEDAETPAGGEDGGNQEEETETQNNNTGVNEDDLRQESEDDSEKTMSPQNASSVSSPGLDSDKAIATEEDDEEEKEEELEQQQQEEEEEEEEEEEGKGGSSRPKKMAKKSWVVEDSDEDSEKF